MTTTTSPLLHGTYLADPVHSSFGFAVSYQGVSVYRGTFTEVAATLTDGRLEGAAKVESISIVAPEQFRGPRPRAGVLRRPDHPEIRFQSSDVDLRDDGSAVVEGELTMKGITHSVTATGTWTAPQSDAFGNTRGHLQLETEVDRTKWDMNWTPRCPAAATRWPTRSRSRRPP